jgi:hypothetical protein
LRGLAVEQVLAQPCGCELAGISVLWTLHGG